MRKLSAADDLWLFALQPISETTLYCGFLNNIDLALPNKKRAKRISWSLLDCSDWVAASLRWGRGPSERSASLPKVDQKAIAKVQ
jgi:hypothetical protein